MFMNGIFILSGLSLDIELWIVNEIVLSDIYCHVAPTFFQARWCLVFLHAASSCQVIPPFLTGQLVAVLDRWSASWDSHIQVCPFNSSFYLEQISERFLLYMMLLLYDFHTAVDLTFLGSWRYRNELFTAGFIRWWQ